MLNSIKIKCHKTVLILISCLLINVVSANESKSNSNLSTRTESDLIRDKTSKPYQIAEFAGVKSDENVLDLFGGGGYYSEILAQAVGKNGSVTLHNNQAYLPYVGVELQVRLSDKRLKNVTKLMSEAKDLKLGNSQYDLVVLVLGYHDFFYSADKWHVTADKVMPQLLKALKSKGRLLVIDHNASVGTGASKAQALHRIEAVFAKKDIQSRGFTFLKESSLLRSSVDPLDIKVFDPKIRRKTDRFVYLFSKP